ncbi:hypothetical protein ZOSMA_135G00510 [Zostera marina]|uniref:MORF/ORRM1/DAG-like MORF domain-containing protein n=1 Tax=Zostera marina TaxID=29655 RepID=A0A0K9Q0W2_ZOSMR|nr:hypothetical protein ZOSMA_135G00510 [Zostera marina]
MVIDNGCSYSLVLGLRRSYSILRRLPGVLWVLPDSYLDVPNKDYGGDLFVGGQVIHRPQFNFSQRQQQNRNRPRPRYDRRRETMQVERCDQTTVNPQQISDQEQH